MTIIARQQALERGLTHYFTGKPCKRGHVALRITSHRRCIECNREDDRARSVKHKEKESIRRRHYYEKNKEQILLQRRQEREINPEQSRMACRKYYSANKEAMGRKRAAYYQVNREAAVSYSNHYQQRRRRVDPGYAITLRLRSRINHAIKGTSKSAKTTELVGCSPGELVRHLESQFVDGMSWENRHLWAVDHIRPCASFDLADPEQQRQCFHYSNLQPLWAVDNMRKGARWQNAA